MKQNISSSARETGCLAVGTYRFLSFMVELLVLAKVGLARGDNISPPPALHGACGNFWRNCLWLSQS